MGSAADSTAPTKPNAYQRPNYEPDHGDAETATNTNQSDESGPAGSCINRINRVDLEPTPTRPRTEKRNGLSNKMSQALLLPTVMNLNPHSVYNKVEDFHTFVDVEVIDCIFMSESWERLDQPLEEIIHLPDHTIISNPHQRRGQGGRPALIINHRKYIIKNLTQSLIQIPWGTEAVWALLTPKSVNKDSRIQRIAVCSFYSKPNSTRKTQLLDHINQAFNIISTKYNRGLHFILAADSNDLKLDHILSLSSQMRQMVTGVTRLNPPKMIDPIITTLHTYYQEPIIFPPLDPDPDSDGKPSDHFIPVMRPINMINNKSARTHRVLKVRPILESGMNQLKSWMGNQTWIKILEEESIDKKAIILQEYVLEQVNKFLPEKRRVIASDDDPWVTEDVKKLNRQRQREYRKNKNSCLSAKGKYGI